jgi:putative DNA primase/helicase
MGRVMGDYSQAADFSTFLDREDSGVRNDIAALRGARLVTAIEAGQGRRLGESVIKQMTGGDRIRARFLYQEGFEFTPTFKVWLAANHKPRIVGTDEGIWRRVRLIPFTVQIPETERDIHLIDKLTAELPGVLAWMVRGSVEWQRNGLGTPVEVREATDTYRQESDGLAAFIDGCCVKGDKLKAEATPLYLAYQRWAPTAGELPLSQRMFGQRLAEKGFVSTRDTYSNRKQWTGLGLLSSERSEPSEPFSP